MTQATAKSSLNLEYSTHCFLKLYVYEAMLGVLRKYKRSGKEIDSCIDTCKMYQEEMAKYSRDKEMGEYLCKLGLITIIDDKWVINMKNMPSVEDIIKHYKLKI